MLGPIGREGGDRSVRVWRAAEIVAFERNAARIVTHPGRAAVEGRARNAARLRLGPLRLDSGIQAGVASLRMKRRRSGKNPSQQKGGGDPEKTSGSQTKRSNHLP